MLVSDIRKGLGFFHFYRILLFFKNYIVYACNGEKSYFDFCLLLHVKDKGNLTRTDI